MARNHGNTAKLALKQLVLGRGQADLPGLRLRPAQEAAQPDAEGEQVLVVLAGQPIHVRHRPGLPAGPVPASALPVQLNVGWSGPACGARPPPAGQHRRYMSC